MLKMIIGQRVVELQDDIKTLPASQYQLAHQYQIMSRELPGSEAELQAALIKLQLFNRVKQSNSFEELLHNIRLGRRLILANYSPKQLEWACYLATVDGIAITDYSEANLERLVAELNPIQAELETTLYCVKAKIDTEISRYFPRKESPGRQRNSDERYRTYLFAQLAHAIERTEASAQRAEAALAEVMHFQKPVCFQEGKNLLIQIEKSHQKLTFSMAESGCPTPDTLTVFQFYGWQEQLEDKYRAAEPTPPANRAARPQ